MAGERDAWWGKSSGFGGSRLPPTHPTVVAEETERGEDLGGAEVGGLASWARIFAVVCCSLVARRRAFIHKRLFHGGVALRSIHCWVQRDSHLLELPDTVLDCPNLDNLLVR